MTRTSALLIAALCFAATSAAAVSAAIKYDTPAGWVVKPAASSMRVAEFALPKADGDPEDASVVLYFFGGQGGSAQANLDRWIGQVTQPDGKPSKDVAKVDRFKSHGLDVTAVDVSGTYVAEMAPGATERFNKPAFRLRAAVIETPEGPYFVKAVGPSKTMARWQDSITTFVKSLHR
jgi:hypothetical protein